MFEDKTLKLTHPNDRIVIRSMNNKSTTVGGLQAKRLPLLDLQSELYYQ